MMKTFLIEADVADPVLAHAVRELAWIIEATTAYRVAVNEQAGEAAGALALKVAPELPKHAFEIRPARQGAKAVLRGHNASAVLAAAYTFLEEAGVYFEACGPRLPQALGLKKAFAVRRRVAPVVAERGIRQHINFPMDISSYPLSEALEYVRNLARLRFNHITFHSYPKQWYSYQGAGEKVVGGHFFYGTRHDLPELPELRGKIRNRGVYCIPEIEPVYDDIVRREAAAVEWLTAVMNEARRVGLTVQFSTQYAGASAEDCRRACEAALATYPMIDVLELLTPENEHKTEERLTLYLEAFRLLREQKADTVLPRFALGIYDTAVEFIAQGIEALRRKCPKDIAWVVLPAHGARQAVENLKTLKLRKSDWKTMRLYSWVEFDGLMYLQQNSLAGSRMAVDYLRSMADRNGAVFGLDFNHWRTEENLIPIRYAAEVCLASKQSPREFSRAYAEAVGIGSPDLFAKAMLLLDDTDTFCRDHLFNLGFCWLSCWDCFDGLGRVETWKTERQRTALRNYGETRAMLEQALERTRDGYGRKRVRFLLNRIDCTILHLRAIGEFLALRDWFGTAKPGPLTAGQAERTRQCCDRVVALAEDYMRLHSLAMPDRGCEGTLVSYAQTLYGYVGSIRSKMLGEGADKRHVPAAPDEAPPPPESQAK